MEIVTKYIKGELKKVVKDIEVILYQIRKYIFIIWLKRVFLSLSIDTILVLLLLLENYINSRFNTR